MVRFMVCFYHFGIRVRGVVRIGVTRDAEFLGRSNMAAKTSRCSNLPRPREHRNVGLYVIIGPTYVTKCLRFAVHAGFIQPQPVKSAFPVTYIVGQWH